MTNRPLGAQISHMLKDRGVDVIFGIPGVHNQEMYRGIEEAGLTHVLARHEQGAGFMADGYARATGRPGVAYVITGPGLTNILTPLGQAYSDSVPVLAISSCLEDTVGVRGQLHQMRDQRAAAATVCDWSEEARGPQSAYRLIDRALAEFHLNRARPKHIQIPIPQLEASAEQAPAAGALPPRPAQDPAAAETILTHLDQAKRPLFVLGGGCRSAQARDVVAASGAAAFTTYAADGLLGDLPLNFGPFLARPGSAEVIAQADLVIAMGTELAEVDIWRDHLGHQATLIRVDCDPDVLADRQGARIALCADAPAVLASLQARLADAPRPAKWPADQVARARATWRAEASGLRPGIAPLCDALRASLPDTTMIYSDMTQFAYVAKEIWPMPRPGHWHHPSGFGTLGYALPAAIGGGVARRGLPTLAIAGDYGFQYTLQELGTAVELGLSLPILLWDNAKLKEIEDSMTAAQIAPNAIQAHNPDFCKLAEAYGARAARPASLAALCDAVTGAFLAPVPTLIHATPAITQ